MLAQPCPVFLRSFPIKLSFVTSELFIICPVSISAMVNTLLEPIEDNCCIYQINNIKLHLHTFHIVCKQQSQYTCHKFFKLNMQKIFLIMPITFLF